MIRVFGYVALVASLVSSFSVAAKELPKYLQRIVESDRYEISDSFDVSEFVAGHVVSGDSGQIIVYSLPDGMVFQGMLVNPDGQMISQIHDKKYLTEKHVQPSNGEIIERFTFTQGRGDLVSYVFFDPLCGFCKSLYAQAQEYLDQIKLVWVPVQIFEGSAGLLQAILNSPDPDDAFLRHNAGYQFAPVKPNAETFDAVMRHTSAMRGFDLSATPSGYIDLGDGSRKFFSGANIENLL